MMTGHQLAVTRIAASLIIFFHQLTVVKLNGTQSLKFEWPCNSVKKTWKEGGEVRWEVGNSNRGGGV